jgi:transketolase
MDVKEVNGKDMAALVDCLDGLDAGRQAYLVIAHTTRVRVFPFMENVASWHHGVPTSEQLALALSEIDARIHTLKEKP